MSEGTSWTDEVVRDLNEEFSASSRYRVVEIVPFAEKDGDSLNVRVETLDGLEARSFTVQGLGSRELFSGDDSHAEPMKRAFVLLLHANLDELWEYRDAGRHDKSE